MTAKPAAVTCAVIAMTTATTVTSAGAVHRVVHDDRRSSRSTHAKRGAKADDAIADRRVGEADRGSAQRERSEAESAARSARENDGAAAKPSVGNETGRAAVPLRG